MSSRFTICARIYQFRSIQNSGWFPLRSMTCLVGKNGYGKTTILDALLAITAPNHSNVEEGYHYSDSLTPVMAELAVPVISPFTQERLGVLRVQRLRKSKYRYLFATDSDLVRNNSTPAPQDSNVAAGDSSWPDDLFRLCKENADEPEPLDPWREVGVTCDGAVSLEQIGTSCKSYNGSPGELVLRAAENGLRRSDGKMWLESVWFLIPRITRIPGRTACGDSASRKGLDFAGDEAIEHLNQVELNPSVRLDPEKILRAFIFGCLPEDAANSAPLDNRNLKGVPNSSLGHLHLGKENNSLTLNQIIEKFWDKEFQINIDQTNGRFEVKFQKGKEHSMEPSKLSKGTKWFFGFLSLAVSARRDAVCHAISWNKGKSSIQKSVLVPQIIERIRRKVRSVTKREKPLFRAPVLFLLDEPATFMHVELQSKWLELMELFTSLRDDASLRYPLVTWLAPWFCFATHAPSLVRPEADLVLAVDRLHEQEAIPANELGKYRQAASTIIRCPQVYDSNDRRYQKVIACFLRAHSDSAFRVFLEGQSDRFLLNFAIKGVISDGRPFYDPIPVEGVADKKKVWDIFWKNYLSDEDWMESTRKIIVIFDADSNGETARDYLEKKFNEEKAKFNITNEKFVFSSIGEITGVQGATAEDLLPLDVIKNFCKQKLENMKVDAPTYRELTSQGGASGAFKVLEKKSLEKGALKKEFLEYLRKRTPQECYQGHDEFKERLASRIQNLFS